MNFGLKPPKHLTAGKDSPLNPERSLTLKLRIMKILPAGIVKGMPAFANLSGYTVISQPVLADSIEVVEEFYQEKINLLESSLKQLNVLENSREIAFLCREITGTKKALQDIFRKKKYRNT
jgi:hypothetical protein